MQKGIAPSQDRPRRGDFVQGFGFLSDRLSQRVIQVRSKSGQAARGPESERYPVLENGIIIETSGNRRGCDMIQGRCPICKKRFETETIDAWPGFPFCSERCKLIDLGRWIDGDYLIPGKEEPLPSAEEDEE